MILFSIKLVVIDLNILRSITGLSPITSSSPITSLDIIDLKNSWKPFSMYISSLISRILIKRKMIFWFISKYKSLPLVSDTLLKFIKAIDLHQFFYRTPFFIKLFFIKRIFFIRPFFFHSRKLVFFNITSIIFTFCVKLVSLANCFFIRLLNQQAEELAFFEIFLMGAKCSRTAQKLSKNNLKAVLAHDSLRISDYSNIIFRRFRNSMTSVFF